MKKIQIITYEPDKISYYPTDIAINNFNQLKALDDYDINVFNLNCEEMWSNKSTEEQNPSLETIMTADFKSINKMINNSKKAINLICIPQNLEYFWKCYATPHKKQLKDMISIFVMILEQIIPITGLEITYENSTTLVNGKEVNSSFYINNDEYNILTKSNNSDKTTTIENDKLIITTLNIINDSYDLLIDYLKQIGLIEKNIEYPEWLYKYSYNDDEIQNKKIEQARQQIKIQEEIIEQSNDKLQKNLHFKSILYNNSDKLVSVVFEILEDIYGISLEDFKDELKEDFLYKKDNVTYIGEIKGVTSNVKFEYISQLDVHYSKYLDKLQEEGLKEDIRKLLIINYERKKDVVLRDKINKEQIDLAKRNNSLIIDTKSLLIIYEKVLKGELNRKQVIDYIKNNTGLINPDLIK